MSRDDSGFTLVEALISLFVFSLIAAGAVLMLMQGVETQNRVGAAQAALREVQTARALLGADLAQFAPRLTRGADGVPRPLFIGGDADDALAFVRASAEPDGAGGARTSLAYVRYRIDGARVLRSSDARLDFQDGEPAGERVILSDAADAHFEFYDGNRWLRQWLVGAQGGAPPRAVALAFTSPRYGPVRIEAATGLGR